MPGRDGSYRMRVVKEPVGGTYTQVNLPEHEIVSKIVEENLRNGTVINRKQAISMYLAEYVLPKHTHRSWLTSFEVHDDGPHEPTLRSELARHVGAGNINSDDVEGHVSSYLESVNHVVHKEHLHKFFTIKAA